ncbi:unnamed protein product [Calicophoron daubneyi]|uniref:Ig-like domain-containing protein n=1 Tax=Calicophoron daubneyi TaxID=300641 RepID=A0AAV2TLM1_CALDB
MATAYKAQLARVLALKSIKREVESKSDKHLSPLEPYKTADRKNHPPGRYPPLPSVGFLNAAEMSTSRMMSGELERSLMPTRPKVTCFRLAKRNHSSGYEGKLFLLCPPLEDGPVRCSQVGDFSYLPDRNRTNNSDTGTGPNTLWLCKSRGMVTESAEPNENETPVDQIMGRTNSTPLELVCVVASIHRLKRLKGYLRDNYWYANSSRSRSDDSQRPGSKRFVNVPLKMDLQLLECSISRLRSKRNSGIRSLSAVQIDVQPSSSEVVHAGSRVRVRCSIRSVAGPAHFALLRKLFGENQAYPVAETTSTSQVVKSGSANSEIYEKEYVISLQKQDCHATFFCEVILPDLNSMPIRSDGKSFNVTFPPDSVHVVARPATAVSESAAKVFTCELGEYGSNPPSELIWTQLDSAGAQLPMDDVSISPTEQVLGRVGSTIARSNLTVNARRALNGRRFECTVVYQQRETNLRSEEILEVIFSPNNVRLNAQPMGGVQESNRLELTCATSSCHPPAVIRWFEVSPSVHPEESGSRWGRQESESGANELTDLAQMDTKPDPPSIRVQSLPPEPMVGQSALLSCQSSGGNPQTGYTYTWYVAHSSQLSESWALQSNQTSEQALIGLKTGKKRQPDMEFVGTSYLNKPLFTKMIRISEQKSMHLNITSIKLRHRGWYACEISSLGGESHTLFFLDVFYQPRVDQKTKFRVAARVGDEAELVLYVDANPQWAEATWYQISHVTSSQSLRSQGRGSDTFLTSPSDSYDSYDSSFGGYDYGIRRIRSPFQAPSGSSGISRQSRRRVGDGSSNRMHIVSERGTGAKGNLTFILKFNGVQEEDFGEYICHIRHKLGAMETHFQLVNNPGSDGIPVSSIKVLQRGAATVVLFNPPNKPSYTRMILRVCKRGTFRPFQPTSKSDITEKPPDEILADVQETHPRIYARPLRAYEATENEAGSHVTPKMSSKISSNQNMCEDYQVPKPQSGETELKLSDAVQLYNFRFLLYEGSKVVHQTPPILWQPEIASAGRTGFLSPMVLSVTGGCLLFVILMIAMTVLLVLHRRRKTEKNPKNRAAMESHINSTGPTSRKDATSDAGGLSQHRPGGLAYELRSDIGSVRSYQHSDVESSNVPLMRRMVSPALASCDYGLSSTGLPNSPSSSCSKVLPGDRYSSSMQQSKTASGKDLVTLSNRMLTEAYLAAVGAASAAAAAAAGSVTTGSTDLYSNSAQLPGHLRPSLTESDQKEMNEREMRSKSGAGLDSPSKSSTHRMKELRQRLRTRVKQRDGSQTLLSTQASKTNLISPTDDPSSRSSVQFGGRRASQCGSLSGTSFTSLNNPSQTSLEAAARAAAAAAVAAVMRNIGSGLFLHHAVSQTHLAGPRMWSRPSSRAASVAGPTGKFGLENGDGESMNYSSFGQRYVPHPYHPADEMTPTASHADVRSVGQPDLPHAGEQPPHLHPQSQMYLSPNAQQPGNRGFESLRRNKITTAACGYPVTIPENGSSEAVQSKIQRPSVEYANPNVPIYPQQPLGIHPLHPAYQAQVFPSQQIRYAVPQQQFGIIPPDIRFQYQHPYQLQQVYQMQWQQRHPQPLQQQQPQQQRLISPQQFRPISDGGATNRSQTSSKHSNESTSFSPPGIQDTGQEHVKPIPSTAYTSHPQVNNPQPKLTTAQEPSVPNSHTSLPENPAHCPRNGRGAGEGRDQDSNARRDQIGGIPLQTGLNRSNGDVDSLENYRDDNQDGKQNHSNPTLVTPTPVRRTDNTEGASKWSTEASLSPQCKTGNRTHSQPATLRSVSSNSSLRKSPMGASFHVIGNGNHSVNDDHFGSGMNGKDVYGDSRPNSSTHGKYKHQPRLGIHSYERSAFTASSGENAQSGGKATAVQPQAV